MLPSSLPETVNYHYTSACEMACEHCFAVFADCTRSKMDSHKAVIRAISEEPLGPGMYLPRRLNFVGGEPTVHQSFPELLEYALQCGLRTSIVTNGYSLVKHGLPEKFHELDLIGVSIDSLNHDTNIRIGRSVRIPKSIQRETISEQQWNRLFNELQQAGIALKINTTVTRHNADEDLSSFILKSRPERWKIFQAMPVDGQNCGSKHRWLVDRPTYDQFVTRHVHAGAYSEAEPESLMRGSYAMISPDGRFFDSALGSHNYSAPIPEVGVRKAWNQIHFDSQLFGERTKNYSDMTDSSAGLIAS